MRKFILEIKNKSIEQLKKEVSVLREEITNLILNTKVNPQKDTNLLVKKRKRLAVILTVINSK